MIFGAVLLAVSLVAFCIQSLALAQLVQPTPSDRAERLVHYGCIRTAVTRVVCAALYATVGAGTIAALPWMAEFGLVVFSVTQSAWMANARLDVRMRRRIAALVQGQP